MLLHYNEDFDDDFLLDSMNVLGQEWIEWLLCIINRFNK